MEHDYVGMLVERIALDANELHVSTHDRGETTLSWRPSGRTGPVTLVVREGDLGAAVTFLGEECREELWPNSSIVDAGFNMLLTHLDEVVATRNLSEPLRVGRRGLIWPSGH